MHYQTYVDRLRPQLRKDALLYDILLIIGASIFITLSAQIAFNVPFSPVPVTGQTFAVLLTGSFLGSRRGALAVLLYLFEGVAGIPVFAQAHAGLIHLLGPTGGYLFGFIPAAYLCGLMVEKGWGRTMITVLVIMSVGTGVIFIFGIFWLMFFVGIDNMLMLGFYPYITGAMIKIIAATFVYSGGGYLTKKNNN
jgi:biotin transport system substrate-specific component